jgi:TM2 domain-containing membrane protein YozV/ribosomal protein L40E
VNEPSSEPPEAASGSRERGPDEAFCRNCGAVIASEAELCPDCGVRQRDPPRSGLDAAVEDLFEGGNPFVAAVLSALFPGLGQIYNRELEKGLAVVVATFLALFSVLVGIGLLLYPAVLLYAVYDAYTVADGRPEAAGEPSSTG